MMNWPSRHGKTLAIMPFKDFTAYTVWYDLRRLGNDLFEALKEDVCGLVIEVTAYAGTFRRQFLETAGQLVQHGRQLMLKVAKTTFERLQIDLLFSTCR